jgi:hypothetical protein|tara:strand:+ start:13 stop:390 length:378 start_codon:yes stop_codon:yes gene_type:complete
MLSHPTGVMQYFQAVQTGKKRANESQMKLFDIAGFAMLTLTTKKIDGKFFPVGEENYAAAIKKPEGYVVILVDEDGYTKTQSKDLEKTEASEIYKKIIESGIEEYSENEIIIWTEKFPAVQNELR